MRADNRPKMEHAFGSAIICQNLKFDELDDSGPVNNHTNMHVSDFLPSKEDMSAIQSDYVILMSWVAMKYLPFFKMFEDIVPKTICEPPFEDLKRKSKVIPLAVLFENEQYYQDVVKILAYYEKFITESCEKLGHNIENVQIHIGGDQLTRERFSGAKSMRAHHVEPSDKFEHLGPITFEYFHMQMNFLQIIFKHLYNDDSTQNIGTLKSLQQRISRTNISTNVTSHYDEDRDFVISVVDMYIVELLMEHFGLTDIIDNPTRNIPPQFSSQEDKTKWFWKVMASILETSLFSKATKEVIKEETLTGMLNYLLFAQCHLYRSILDIKLSEQCH